MPDQEKADRAAKAIGRGAPNDYIIDPAAHGDRYRDTAPELSTILDRSAVRGLGEDYMSWDRRATESARQFQTQTNRVSWSVLLVAICSAGILATSSVAPTGDGGPFAAAVLVLGLTGLLVGTVGTVSIGLLNSRGLLPKWLKARGAAETARVDYVEAVVGAEPAADPDQTAWIHLLKLEYFRRYQLDVQYAYFGQRGEDHERAMLRTSTVGAWALGIVGLANGAAGMLGWWDLRWSALAALAVVAQALADRSKSMDTLTQSSSNAEVYQQLHRQLRSLRSKFDDVRDLVAAGQVDALTEYVRAVHDLLAAERGRWSDTMASAETGIARFQAQLEKLQSGIGPQTSPT